MRPQILCLWRRIFYPRQSMIYLLHQFWLQTSEDIAKEVQRELEAQLAVLERKEIAGKSIADYGAIIIVESLKDAATVVKQNCAGASGTLRKRSLCRTGGYKECGCDIPWQLFPQSLWETILAGPNHVLPTSGTARFFSPLNLFGFYEEKQHYFIYKRCPSKG